MLGHSAGEAAAGYASGAYSLAYATRLVHARSRLQQKMAGSGRMLVLPMARVEVEAALTRFGFDLSAEGAEVSMAVEGADGSMTVEPIDGSVGAADGANATAADANVLDIACVNSPSNTVVGGAAAVIARLQDALAADGLPSGRLIAGNIAFHSRHMAPIEAELKREVEGLGVPVAADEIPHISTVSGGVAPPLDAAYWWSNVRQPVQLLDAVRTARRLVQPEVIIEISPHITLRSPIRECYEAEPNGAGADGRASMPTYVPTMIRGVDSALAFADALNGCFKAGIPVDVAPVLPASFAPLTHVLPAYPMKHERLVVDRFDVRVPQLTSFCRGLMLGVDRMGSGRAYEVSMSKDHYPWMAGHVVQHTVRMLVCVRLVHMLARTTREQHPQPRRPARLPPAAPLASFRPSRFVTAFCLSRTRMTSLPPSASAANHPRRRLPRAPLRGIRGRTDCHPLSALPQAVHAVPQGTLPAHRAGRQRARASPLPL